MVKQFICTSCGSLSKGEKKYRGSDAIEIILWLCFLIPGVIYSFWRMSSKYSACPTCGNTNIVPLESPAGRKMLADQGKTVDQAAMEIKNQPMPLRKKIWIGVAIIFGLMVIQGLSFAFSR